MLRLSTAVALAFVVALGALPADAGRGRGGGGGGGGGERRDDRDERRDERREDRREGREDRREEHQDGDGARKGKADPGVNKRQRRQGSRIIGGVRSGQLTKTEVDALTAREASLRGLEASLKADGKLTAADRQRLHDELDALSRDIRSEKHDADRTAPLRVRDGNDDRAGAGRGRRLGEVRRELNRPDLPPDQRAALEAEHTKLVDELFEEAGEG